MHNILIVTSVQAEREAVERGLKQSPGFHVLAGGVGAAASAASTMAACLEAAARGIRYELIINAGIGGGFREHAAIGDIVIASEIVAADFGAESAEGFISVDELGFGSGRRQADERSARRWMELLRAADLHAVHAPVVTVTTATGTAATAGAIQARVANVAAEAMEGFGAAVAASQLQIPVLEVRAISNEVGPRNRDAWRIGEALKSLEAACRLLPEVFA
ncbi:futalosine hydrolase [Paenibacillus sp. GCM10027626]|uniref:futalosine hydrolase n=1 Tax=Paenibacillus sp. GCM10027626 TaxID=3273411 RepID=UPI00363544D9